MPLPSVLAGALQCQVSCKRTGIRCKNPAAFGMKACRLHGSRRSRNTLRGADHPQYRNGKFTKEAKAEISATRLRLRMLEEIGFHINMFAKGSARTRGTKPNGWVDLDLENPEEMAKAVVMTFQKSFP